MIVEPYLSFEGRCEEAINFYRAALGAEVMMMMRFKESPDRSMEPPGTGDKIMHASLRIGQTRVMMSDGQCTGQSVGFKGISLSISVADAAEAQRVFGALSDGGQVHMPLTKTFFSESFGVLADRFGVSWMVIVGQ
jgi:PhnB protein